MTLPHHDINDDEIRVISPSTHPTPSTSSTSATSNDKPSHSRHTIVGIAIIVAGIVVASLCTFFAMREDEEAIVPSDQSVAPNPIAAEAATTGGATTGAKLEVADTVVNGIPLTILTPLGATPSLEIGADRLNDSTALLVVPTAGIREDNGQIVGACVIDGRLISRGESKGGYCAIIDNNLCIGTADATPLFEQAVESGGSFFRQYPLVVASQEVVNRPKGRSLRKALAELNGRICVILSRERITFADFSAALVEAGVTNAIYLDGGPAAVAYRSATDSTRTILGDPAILYPDAPHLLWR